MHLSMSDCVLSLAQNLPANPDVQYIAGGPGAIGGAGATASILYPMGRGYLSTSTVGTDRNGVFCSCDSIHYVPRRREADLEERPSDHFVSRLVLCDDVEKSIRNWNPEPIKEMIATFNLRVVPFDEGDPLRPGLHIRQNIVKRD